MRSEEIAVVLVRNECPHRQGDTEGTHTRIIQSRQWQERALPTLTAVLSLLTDS